MSKVPAASILLGHDNIRWPGKAAYQKSIEVVMSGYWTMPARQTSSCIIPHSGGLIVAQAGALRETMSTPTVTELLNQIEELRRSAIRLSAIVLSIAFEHRELVDAGGSEPAPHRLATTPATMVARLREASMRCNQLSLTCRGTDAGHTLEGLSAELAAEAEHYEALLRIPGADG
jgi:hypothetical protein